MRIALLGYGYWGRNVLRNLRRIPHLEILCCDTDPRRLDMIRVENPDLPVSSDVEAVLRDTSVDGLCIATPASTHYDLTRRALLAGKHVYVEKPLATKAHEALDLARLSKETGRTLLVGHVFRHSTAARKVKDLLEEGEIGELRYVYSVRTSLGPRSRNDVNAIWDYSIHDLYLVPYFLGRMPVSVCAWGSSFLQPGIEDVVFIKLDFPGGVMAHLQGSWYDPLKRRDMTLVGSRASIRYDDSLEMSKVVSFRRGWMPYPGIDSMGNHNMTIFEGDSLTPHIQPCEPLLVQIHDFLECIRTGRQPLCDGLEGWRTVALAEAAEQSLRQDGKLIPLADLSDPS